ncbi:MAG: poly-gamma-glutamate system protein [Deltaproteobacteria bacterium]|nr:poly-gamma-glutamate system protein [Deltaproteobacteria bacterium]MCB9478324.1 poly-gamma-glutamate system protein [Deltaproteobacteria bacterium]MCB9489308.1 poly-gamma-glutamate system protein [Deltaproteobacteria bacterium]
MRKVYWRPHRVSRMELIVIAVIAVVGVFLCERIRVREQQPMYEEKIRAAHIARDAFNAIKAERLRIGPAIDPETDPQESGIIGLLMSPVTTNTGSLPAKQTTINPNFAAVIVHFLERAGVKEGDTIGIGVSGSFPAINVCAYSACEALGVKPIVIASVSGSQWGANLPRLLWIDMERLLFKKEIIHHRSIAGSRGGVEDRALGLSREGRDLLDRAIKRNELIAIKEPTYLDSLNRRMLLYDEYAGNTPMKAYINIGGGAISVGTSSGKKAFHEGLTRTVTASQASMDSVIGRMALQGIPVIHMVNIRRIAERYGLPVQPIEPPAIGEGDIYYREAYHPYLPYGVLAVVILTMFAFIRLDWGFRILKSGRSQGSNRPSRPEQMV